MTTDNFGDRIKAYEALETERKFMPGLPIYARIDGRSFSVFTRGMVRPYDVEMSRCMLATTIALVEKTHAKIGYTQSDEISLVYLCDKPESQPLFGGKVHKLTSVLASLATSAFCNEATYYWPDKVKKMLPHFDARVFNLPNLTEAANTVLWREQDATKNAISMAARAYFSHNELHGKSGAEMQEMLFSEKGINFNNYPDFFKRGTFIQRRMEKVDYLGPSNIPEQYRPKVPFFRSRTKVLDMPKFSTVQNRVGVIFNNEDPVV